MATFRVSYYDDKAAWQLLESGRRIRFVANKQQAKNMADRRAQPGDTIVTERKDGSVMSEREVEEMNLINTGGGNDDGFLGMF